MSEHPTTRSTVLREAAQERLKGVLALVRRAPGWLTAESFATDPVLPISSLEGARQLASVVRNMCGGRVIAAPAVSDDPACATALVTGSQATVLVGCRVEEAAPYRIVELVLLPTVGRPGAITLPASRTVTRDGVRADLVERLEGWLTAARRDLNLVGVVAAVYDGQTVVWSGSTGQGSLEDPASPDPASCLVRIGSITKTMLTVRCLQLVDQGVLGLEDRVGDVLVSWPLSGALAGDLQVRHLLSHTGGIREVPEDRYFVPQDGPEPDLEDWLDRPVEVDGVPGREWSYSNVGMTLLGQLIADVAGRDFEADVQEHVFDRLGMHETSFRLDGSRRAAVMRGFAEGLEGVAPVDPVHVGARAAGSVFSTLRDMGLWAGEVVAGVRGEGALLPAERWEDCLTPVVPIPGTGMSMARGFLRVDEPDRPDDPVVWHNGALPGAAAQLWIAPRSGLSLALFTNVWSPWRTMVLERRCLRLLRDLTSAAG